MNDTSKHKQKKSLIGQLKRRLFIVVSLLIFTLIFGLLMGILDSLSLYGLGEQNVALQENVNGILVSMIDQETGLRGYITTNDTIFLEPFNSGRPQFLLTVQHLKDHLQTNGFSDTKTALAQVEVRANNWYGNYAEVQIKSMQSGHFATARAESTLAAGKALFDKFRASVAQLQQAANSDLNNRQMQIEEFSWFALISILVLSVIAVITAWYTFSRLVNALNKQLNLLKTTTNQLGSGDLSARVKELTYDELNRLGQTFNTVAEDLQKQQDVLKERDVLESVLQLNTTLTGSLDLKALTDEFLSKVLTLLDLHLGALYLYDPERKKLTLFATQGSDYRGMLTDFEVGEGTVGRAALDCKPLYLTRPSVEEEGSFNIKTMSDVVVPISTYYLPLMNGNELLGVLGVGSALPMNEKARNVLNVVASNLSAALINVRSYQHIQIQTNQLVERAREQEQMNNALRQQRDELTLLNSALEEANRARSQFLSTMSHELRTPLASIIGFSQILLKDIEKANLNQRVKSNLERILKNGKHLLALINDVLDLAKVEAGRMDVNCTQLNVRELLNAVVEETQSIAIERKLILKSSVEEGIHFIESDEVKLRQILINLVANALKFTEQGEVTLTATRATSSDNEVECIAIAVKDTGIGIPPEMQSRIFEAFYQVDGGDARKFGGTGLGLSIVSQLTTLLGGKIEVKSSPGQGSTFTLLLPIKVEDRQAEQDKPRLYSAQQEIPRALPSASELTPAELAELFKVSVNQEATGEQNNLVLAVDDNVDALIMIKSALQDTPYSVVGVQDPLKVMEMVQKLRPCAITLDVMMPNLNGWQVLHQLKLNPATASIPVVMLTILSERTTGYVLGADDYLIKPFKNDVLQNTVHHLISSKKSLSQVSG